MLPQVKFTHFALVSFLRLLTLLWLGLRCLDFGNLLPLFSARQWSLLPQSLSIPRCCHCFFLRSALFF